MTANSKYYYPFESEINNFILSNLNLQSNFRCIDLGCGASSLYKVLCKSGCTVFKVDKDIDVINTYSQDSIQNENLFEINKDILSLQVSELGKFDVIIFSLVSLYNSSSSLEKIWVKISEISNTSVNIFCVDLHPISKFENYPWRKLTKTNSTYKDTQLISGILSSGNTELSINYYHHTLENLFKNPIKYGFHLEVLYEFPDKFENVNLKLPAYLCTKWIK